MVADTITIARRLGKPGQPPVAQYAGLVARKGYVVSTNYADSPPTVEVTLNIETDESTTCYLLECTPQVGDNVWVLIVGTGALVLGYEHPNAMRAWTPEIIQSSGFVETVNFAFHEISNNWCTFAFKLTVSTGTGTAGQTITVSMPVACHASISTISPIGTFRGTDSSTPANDRGGDIILSTTTTMRFGPSGYTASGGIWGQANPNFALTTGDIITGWGRYPLAGSAA